MKTILKLAIVSTLIAALNIACKTQQENTRQSHNQHEGEKKYELVVSFFSVAYGIDSKALTGLDHLIQQDTTQNGYSIQLLKTPWGREGEIDYCFDLSALSNQQKNSFIASVKSVLAESKLVHINENAPCRHAAR